MGRYDWSQARRGHWVGKLKRGDAVKAGSKGHKTPVGGARTLEPELARAFPDDESVNAALRAVLDAAKAVRRTG
jgi:hypothetical protein